MASAYPARATAFQGLGVEADGVDDADAAYANGVLRRIERLEGVCDEDAAFEVHSVRPFTQNDGTTRGAESSSALNEDDVVPNWWSGVGTTVDQSDPDGYSPNIAFSIGFNCDADGILLDDTAHSMIDKWEYNYYTGSSVQLERYAEIRWPSGVTAGTGGGVSLRPWSFITDVSNGTTQHDIIGDVWNWINRTTNKVIAQLGTTGFMSLRDPVDTLRTILNFSSSNLFQMGNVSVLNVVPGQFNFGIDDVNNGIFGHLLIAGATGTKFGTTTSQKLAFWNSTPIAQPSSTGTTTGFSAGTGNAVNDDSTFTGGTGSTAYTLGDLVLHLKTMGLLAA